MGIMSISTDALIGAMITILIAMASGGFAILKLITANIEKQFKHAEERRKESSEHWQQLFREIQNRHESNYERTSARLDVIEQRLFALERLSKHNDRG